MRFTEGEKGEGAELRWSCSLFVAVHDEQKENVDERLTLFLPSFLPATFQGP